jgi:hypothetical protein
MVVIVHCVLLNFFEDFFDHPKLKYAYKKIINFNNLNMSLHSLLIEAVIFDDDL